LGFWEQWVHLFYHFLTRLAFTERTPRLKKCRNKNGLFAAGQIQTTEKLKVVNLQKVVNSFSFV